MEKKIEIIDKKREILNVSIALFSNRGFDKTSVKDIADKCSMSKATIYKYFESKEEILISVIKHFNSIMIDLIQSVDLNTNLTEKEKFEEKIYLLLKHFFSRRDLTIILTRNEVIRKDKKVEQLIIENKILIFNWIKGMIIECYGEEIRDNIVDVSIWLTGILREMSFLFIAKDYVIGDFKEIAKFVVRNMNAIVSANLGYEPIIKSNLIEKILIDKSIVEDKETLFRKWNCRIEAIRNIIKNDLTVGNKEDVYEILDILLKEIKKEKTNDLLIKGLLLELAKIDKIDENINYLKYIWAVIQK